MERQQHLLQTADENVGLACAFIGRLQRTIRRAPSTE
jgi:hypothetical protein